MEGLRIAPEGEGPYKNAVRPINLIVIDDDEEAWPVDLEEVIRTTPMGNSNPESGWKDLSWTNRPLADGPVANQPLADGPVANRPMPLEDKPVNPKRISRTHANKKRRNKTRRKHKA